MGKEWLVMLVGVAILIGFRVKYSRGLHIKLLVALVMLIVSHIVSEYTWYMPIYDLVMMVFLCFILFFYVTEVIFLRMGRSEREFPRALFGFFTGIRVNRDNGEQEGDKKESEDIK